MLNKNAGVSNSKNISNFIQNTSKSITNASFLGLIGSIFWFITMAFHFLNGRLEKPIDSNLIYTTTDILNILSTIFLVMFAHFLYKNQMNLKLKNFLFIIYIGILLRLIGRIADGIIGMLLTLNAEESVFFRTFYFISDIGGFLGVLSFAALMLTFFIKEYKTSYKVISMVAFIFSLLYVGCYFFFTLLDLNIITYVNPQITRFISLLSSITFIVFFSYLLSDSKKHQNSSSSSVSF